MPGPIKLLLLIIAGLVGSAAQAQLLGPAFESGITLKQEDLDKMRQTVNQRSTASRLERPLLGPIRAARTPEP